MGTELSRKLYKATPTIYVHWCSSCNSRHPINVGEPNSNGASWSFNNNVEAPTFTPSVNIRIGPYSLDDDECNKNIYDVCHYNITDGKITYHGDTTGPLSGQTLELPDFPIGRLP